MANGTPRVKHMRSKKNHSKSKESMSSTFYRHIDPRLKQQLMDSRMIEEDDNATANLSPRVINRMFDPNRYMESLGFFDERSEV